MPEEFVGYTPKRPGSVPDVYVRHESPYQSALDGRPKGRVHVSVHSGDVSADGLPDEQFYGHTDLYPSEAEHRGAMAILQPSHYDRADNNWKRAGEQLELFSHQPARVSHLYVTEDSRHLVPHVVGMLHNLSMEQFGESPQADTNLSQHSLRMVQRLGNAVVNHDRLPTEPRNDADFYSSANEVDDAISRHHEYENPADPDGEKRLREGAKVVRDALRDSRKKPAVAPTPHEDPNQLTLPGM